MRIADQIHFGRATSVLGVPAVIEVNDVAVQPGKLAQLFGAVPPMAAVPGQIQDHGPVIRRKVRFIEIGVVSENEPAVQSESVVGRSLDGSQLTIGETGLGDFNASPRREVDEAALKVGQHAGDDSVGKQNCDRELPRPATTATGADRRLPGMRLLRHRWRPEIAVGPTVDHHSSRIRIVVPAEPSRPLAPRVE